MDVPDVDLPEYWTYTMQLTWRERGADREIKESVVRDGRVVDRAELAAMLSIFRCTKFTGNTLAVCQWQT